MFIWKLNCATDSFQVKLLKMMVHFVIIFMIKEYGILFAFKTEFILFQLNRFIKIVYR